MSTGLHRLVSSVRISRRLWLTFGFLIVLLLAQTALGIFGIRNLNGSVDTLVAASDTASVASNLQAQVFLQRIEARNYLFTGDPQYIRRLGELRDEFDRVAAEAQGAAHNSAYKARFAELARLHAQYHEQFDGLRGLRERQDRNQQTRMDPLAQQIGSALDDVIEKAKGTFDHQLASEVEKAQKHWVLAQLAGLRFRALGDPDAPAHFDANQAEMMKRVDAALAFNRPGFRDALSQVRDRAPDYRAAFEENAKLQADMRRLRDDVVAKTGLSLADAANAIVDAVRADEGAIEKAAEEQVSFATILSLVIGALSAAVGFAACRVISQSIVRPLVAVKGVMTKLTEGHLNVTVPYTDGRDEMAEMARAVADFKEESVQAVRTRIALDRVSANIMMADSDGIITYANTSIAGMFKTAEADIKKALPHFSADGLIGKSFDVFHKDPTHQRRIIAGLNSPYTGMAQAGRRTFKVIANPVVGRHGDRLGTVIEWRDLTDELAIETEIKQMVDAAVRGDFNRRIELKGKSGFFLAVSEGINRLSVNVAEVAEDLAGVLEGLSQGDLSRRMDKHYEGIFHRLKDDYNATAEKLSEIVRRINEAAASIAQASREVADGSLDLSERTEQQASSLEETAASMEQISATVRSNADNAQQVTSVAHEARSAAERGGMVATSAVEAMRHIEASSQKIADIIGVIDEIAFQTNLLALNAAVEAARAGDAGRGFAVVAQEVRNLAQRSAQASKEIKALILDSGAQVRDGVELVRSAGDSLTDIVAGISRVADLVTEIARATTEQATGLDEVNTAIAQMDEMTQKNAALVEESAAASRSLEEQAGHLREQMAFFALDRASAASRGGGFGRHVQLIENTKIDHQKFLENVRNSIEGRSDATAANLADHHTCRLGKWYDSMSEPTIRASRYFAALAEPHARFHDIGKRALAAHEGGDAAGARRLLQDLERQSVTVIDLLDKLAGDVRAMMRSAA